MNQQKSITVAKEINERVKHNCLRNFIETANTLPPHFSCVIDFIEETSIENAMEKLWSRDKVKIQSNLDDWKSCDKDAEWKNL